MLASIFISKKPLKVALLATGDELTHGDILNTNTQEIAKRLTEQNIPVGQHLTSPDKLEEIQKAIVFLLKDHSSIIITGGLGPTSDDRTRFALSKAIHQPLVFDQVSWGHIVTRIQQRHPGHIPPESNRQQALFPKGAMIFNNPHGTANGCGITLKHKSLFMLPGPPHECLAMFQNYVVPQLLSAGYPQEIYRSKWMLCNVSEGHIAEVLDKLVEPYAVSTGYRLASPHLEFKIYSQHKADFEKACLLIESYIKPFQLQHTEQRT